MSPLDKLLRRNSRQVQPTDASGAYPQPPPADNQNFGAAASAPAATVPQPPNPPAGAAPPGAGVEQQHYHRHNPAAGPGPNPQYQVVGQNAGLLVGGAVGAMGGGGSVGGDMIAGQVLGGMVGQRIAQAEKHAYWREQALEYREQLAAGAPPLSQLPQDGEKPSWWSRQGREQRRLKRWERRAARRDR